MTRSLATDLAARLPDAREISVEKLYTRILPITGANLQDPALMSQLTRPSRLAQFLLSADAGGRMANGLGGSPSRDALAAASGGCDGPRLRPRRNFPTGASGARSEAPPALPGRPAQAGVNRSTDQQFAVAFEKMGNVSSCACRHQCRSSRRADRAAVHKAWKWRTIALGFGASRLAWIGVTP